MTTATRPAIDYAAADAAWAALQAAKAARNASVESQAIAANGIKGYKPQHGRDDRDTTLEEQVLWKSLTEALAALNDAESVLRYAPDISTNCMGKKPATTTAAALSKARAVLKSNGWQA